MLPRRTAASYVTDAVSRCQQLMRRSGRVNQLTARSTTIRPFSLPFAAFPPPGPPVPSLPSVFHAARPARTGLGLSSYARNSGTKPTTNFVFSFIFKILLLLLLPSSLSITFLCHVSAFITFLHDSNYCFCYLTIYDQSYKRKFYSNNYYTLFVKPRIILVYSALI